MCIVKTLFLYKNKKYVRIPFVDFCSLFSDKIVEFPYIFESFGSASHILRKLLPS